MATDMTGKWSGWYAGLSEPQAYGDVTTYYIGEGYLGGLHVEDWGCGKGYFRKVHDGGYRGIDGTATVFCDEVADLTRYVSNTEAIFMRHVLEHNLEWKLVLDNALESFSKRMVLVLFTPMARETQQIAWNPGVEVPDMSFSHNDITSGMDSLGISVEWKDFDTNTQYGTERVYWLSK